MRNRLQTRRDDLTVSWLELETFVDVNFDNPFDRTDFSNVFNRLHLYASAVGDAGRSTRRFRCSTTGFTEVDTSINFKPSANTAFTFGHRYLNNNPFFLDSSLFTFGGYYRINDNWGVARPGTIRSRHQHPRTTALRRSIAT